MTSPLFSICIPAYKRTASLQRLLDSISIQSFKSFEVIITDDSPGNEVEILCKNYPASFPLHYFHNMHALGTPENWNEAIRKAQAPWIKIMHDDDWFTDNNSLQKFADAILQKSSVTFLFSAYKNVEISKMEVKEVVKISPFSYKSLCKNPFILIAKNTIGPPSCVLYKKTDDRLFDKRLKWVVDFDFYIRILLNTNVLRINEPLISIGLSESQVTNYTFRNKEVEVPEYFLLLEKFGSSILKDIQVYDAYWRLLRNLKVSSPAEIKNAGYQGEIPISIQSMLVFQRKIPGVFIRLGVTSKTLMGVSYMQAYFKGQLR